MPDRGHNAKLRVLPPIEGLDGQAASYIERFRALPVRPFAGLEELDLSKLPDSPKARTVRHILKNICSPKVLKETGLEHLDLKSFMAVKKQRAAFSFATESNLKTGWWSSLLDTQLLKDKSSKEFVRFLRQVINFKDVVEIGPGDQLQRHGGIVRRLGAKSYLGIDLQDYAKASGGLQIDALEFFGQMPDNSVGVIMAFGVFNEPMSMQYPHYAPPKFKAPVKSPASAGRGHAEHEYVRRLAKEMHRCLADDGIVFGDGLHSRGFEQEVQFYLRRAGFEHHNAGYESLSELAVDAHGVRDPFFFKKGKALLDKA